MNRRGRAAHGIQRQPLQPAALARSIFASPALLLILILAAFLRFIRPDLVSITNDEGVHGMLSMNIAIFRNWPLVGLPSVGIRNTPFFLYLLAIPFAIVRHPLAGAVFVAGLNVFAVGVLYQLGLKRFGKLAAISCALLFAAAPWMVMYSRNMWPPSCLALPSLAMIRIGLDWLDDGGNRRLCWVAALALWMPAIHFSGFCATAWTLIVLLAGRRHLRWPPLLGGVVLGLLPWLPWLYFEQFENGWSDFRGVASLAEGKQSLVQSVLLAATRWTQLMTAEGFDYWFGIGPREIPALFPSWLMGIEQVATGVMVVANLSAILYAFLSRRRDLLLLLIWEILPLLLILALRPQPHPHYTLISYPVPFLLIGALVQRIARSRWSTHFVRATIGAIVLLHLVFMISWFRYLDDDQATGRGHFELTYRQRRMAVETILNDANERLIPLIGHFSGQAPAYDFLYNFEQQRRNWTKVSERPGVRYWVDQDPDDQLPPIRARVEKSWRVGPTRIFRVDLGNVQ